MWAELLNLVHRHRQVSTLIGYVGFELVRFRRITRSQTESRAETARSASFFHLDGSDLETVIDGGEDETLVLKCIDVAPARPL